MLSYVAPPIGWVLGWALGWLLGWLLGWVLGWVLGWGCVVGLRFMAASSARSTPAADNEGPKLSA
jgi:hypothetical protein